MNTTTFCENVIKAINEGLDFSYWKADKLSSNGPRKVVGCQDGQTCWIAWYNEWQRGVAKVVAEQLNRWAAKDCPDGWDFDGLTLYGEACFYCGDTIYDVNNGAAKSAQSIIEELSSDFDEDSITEMLEYVGLEWPDEDEDDDDDDDA